MSKKIVAFAGSNSSKSINKKLVRFVLEFFKDYEQSLLDLNDYETVLYSEDREKNDGFPEKVYSFRKQFEDADIIICSLAEHNRSYSVAFKNIYDWSSRIDPNVFLNKPMFLMSTSPGPKGGAAVMNTAITYLPQGKANIIETFSLPSFNKNFDEEKGIIDPELLKVLEDKINTFKKKIINL
ncbi:NAD(P)H-dependent oxidoreductase [Bacteroidales bacterium OttesenSCG-928-K03]|nr:NAD(P)H-dependent oxidoreductase [Odoribacter sp. OttesenSCG-928-L07]MDL2240920.1 NAD(P)H-dependent oxidoreductase [Bacteroidales bacterium OttesenSCG-928-K22]MDL2242517.1 NAD(P)H-dependent oxidoreductase [Bacteroidales bacterium OttesenSCG-928-K03]